MSNKKVIGIHLGKSDDDLKRWVKLVKSKKLEQSFYFKMAILAHISGKRIEIGRVKCQEYIEAIPTSLTLSPYDVELLDFYNKLESQRLIKPATFFKEIFRSSLSYVESEEEEYIPTRYEIQCAIKELAPSLLCNDLAVDSMKTVLNTRSKQEEQEENEVNSKKKEILTNSNEAIVKESLTTNSKVTDNINNKTGSNDGTVKVKKKNPLFDSIIMKR